jgi:D-3-phosphoglycerate dehydrogenase
VALLEDNDDIDFDVVKGLSPEDLAEEIAGYDALIVRSSAKATAEVIAAADQLKVIGRAGVGVDNIDIPAASEKGIVVMNTPGANTVATAEHTMALLLAMCRHVAPAAASLRAGRWDRKLYKGIEMRGKTIGIVGLGRIGRRVARRCMSFGMDVICFDPYLSDDRAHEMRIERVSMDELMARSDFISLHAALTPKTRGMIGEEAIAKMKPGGEDCECSARCTHR